MSQYGSLRFNDHSEEVIKKENEKKVLGDTSGALWICTLVPEWATGADDGPMHKPRSGRFETLAQNQIPTAPTEGLMDHMGRLTSKGQRLFFLWGGELPTVFVFVGTYVWGQSRLHVTKGAFPADAEEQRKGAVLSPREPTNLA